MRSILLLTSMILSSYFCLNAQQPQFPLKPIPAEQWKVTDGWQKAGAISVNPFTNDIVLTKGKELFVGNGSGGMLQTKETCDDCKLQFEFILGPKAEGIFYVLGKFGIILSGEKNKLGGILKQDDGIYAPTASVERAAGIWQQVEIGVRTAESIPTTTLIEYVKVNGFTVLENVFLNVRNPETLPEAVMAFKTTEGIMAIRDFKLLSFKNAKPITIKNIDYKHFEEFNWEAQAVANGTPPTLEGSSKSLNYNVGQGKVRNNYINKYAITLDVSEDGNYAFLYDFAGVGTMVLDGELLLKKTDFQERVPTIVYASLKKGEHLLNLEYIKVWWPAQLGLFVAGDGIRPYPLHELTSLPEKKFAGEIAIKPTNDTEIIRSFFMHNGTKRTHAMSVGSPLGYHYAIDLEQGAILAAWKGGFADVTEMWYERGEPQTLTPKGLTATLSGKPILALKSQKTNLPDTYDNVNEINYKTMHFNEKEQPTFVYTFKNQQLTQRISPISDGLKNNLELNGNTDDLIFRIAEGKTIEKINSYTYRLDNYYIKLSSSVGVEIIENKGQKSLIVDAQPTFNYSIIW